MADGSDPAGPRDDRLGAIAGYLGRRYHYIALPVVMAFMFATRYLSHGNFASDPLELAGIDSYYHWRTTVYTVEHWPNTMPFEVWTYFPEGRYVGQFGTAFDQILATAALVVGLGDPSTATIHQVMLVAVPLMGALVTIPVYLLGKRLGGRLAGLASVVLLALYPGSFFGRSAVGQLDHHVGEVLFMSIAIVAFATALHVADRDKPIVEQVHERDLGALRPTLGYGILAGVALAAFQAVWPAGMLLVGILGVFFVVYLTIEYVAGRSPEHAAFIGVIAMATNGILMLGLIEQMSASSTSFGYLSPLLSFAIAGACAFLAALARRWEREDLDRRLFPAAVAGAAIVALGAMALVLPDVVTGIVDEFLRRMTPFGPQVTDLTIQEAQPPENPRDQAFREFGFTVYTAAIALLGMVVAPFLGRRPDPVHALVVVWGLFMFSMALTQVRFWYYLAVVVAVLNAYFIGEIVRWLDLDVSLDRVREIEVHQVLVLVTVLMVLVVPLVPPVASATVLDVGDAQGPNADTLKWQSSLSYLDGSTPEVGNWGGAGESLEYYGTYTQTADYDYPDGAYGVMSWWDYGHLITVNGERIPRANPFQAGARDASRFLQAQSEERANLLLEAMSTDVDQTQSTEELRAALGEYEDEELGDFRYVMIDDAMATGKFQAISQWTGPGYGAYVTQEQVVLANGDNATVSRMNDRFYDTVVGGFYFGDAAGSEHYRLVHESQRRTLIGSVAQETSEGTWQTIVLNQDLRSLGQQALFTIQSNPQFQLYDQRSEPAVKTFERVTGATLTGESNASPGATVELRLALNSSTERGFTYVQETTVGEDGTFNATVPYATTNELGPDDGYTDSDVYAEGDYQLTVFENGTVEEGTVSVPEPAIYDGAEIEVDLEEFEEQDGNAENGSNEHLAPPRLTG